MLKRILTLTLARNREFYRDLGALGWNIIFPFLIIIGFSLMFSSGERNQYKIGFVQAANTLSPARERKFQDFKKIKYLEFIPLKTQKRAVEKLRHHKIDMVFNPETDQYWISSTSPKGYIVEKMLFSSSLKKGSSFRRETITGEEVPYIEWLFPGILGMNIMFSALFGVGYVIVRYRKNGALKRLSVTPVRTFEFLTSQIISRMMAITLTTLIVYIGCMLLYGFTCRGSYGTLFLVFILGSLSMVSIGLLVSTRSSSEEFAGGVLNLISWPMMFLSEVWFSLEGASPWVKSFSKLFPLTHMIDSARKIMNDGATIGDVKFQVLIMAAITIVSITISSLLFKWQKTT